MEGLRWLLLSLLLLVEISGSPVIETEQCRVDDIPTDPDFQFSKLSGVWYSTSRAKSENEENPWNELLSVVFNFVQSPNGTIVALVTGYSPVTKKCIDSTVHLLTRTDVPGVFDYTSHSDHGTLRVVYVDAGVSLVYICLDPDDDSRTCSDRMRSVFLLSRPHSMTGEQRNTLDMELEDQCLSSLEMHDTQQGMCAIPYINASLASKFDPEVITKSVFTSIHMTVTLTCPILNRNKLSVIWSRINEGGPLLLTYQSQLMATDPRFTLLRPEPDQWNLRIRAIKIQDEGIYRCMNNNEKILTYIVTVLQPPSLVHAPEEEAVVVDEGGDVTLHCDAKGTPPPSISWFSHDSTTGVNTGCGVTKLDVVFILETSSEHGADDIKLCMDFVRFFLVPADIAHDNIRVGFLTYASNTNVRFHLGHYSNKRQLYLNMKEIGVEEDGGSNTEAALHIARTEMFTPGNGDRDDVPNAIFLMSHSEPDVATVNEATLARNAGIHVYVIGSTSDNFESQKNLASEPKKDNSFSLSEFNHIKELRNEIFESLCPEPVNGGQDLVFTSISKENSGDYMCQADNGIEPVAQNIFHLNVNFAPRITVSSNNVPKRVGQDVTLTCTIDASPMDEDLQWLFGGQRITTDLRHMVSIDEEENQSAVNFTLRIAYFSEEDVGEYTCAATNSIGSSQVTIQLSEIQINDPCVMNRTQVQEDFNMWNFVGEWHSLSALKYRYGDSTWDTVIFNYFINRGGYLSYAYQGKRLEQEECSTPGVVTLEYQSPGRFRHDMPEAGKSEIHQFLYTDYNYAIMYICGQFDENGHCAKENDHIEIMTRTFPVPAAKMVELLTIVENFCIDVDDLKDTVEGDCQFPDGYLESVGYQPGGINQEYLCDVHRTRVQADFDIEEFLGEWQTVKTTTFRYGENTPLSEMLHYFQRADGQLILAHVGFNTNSEECVGPSHMELQPVQPGKYTTQYKGNRGSIQIVYTDYSYAVTLSCSKMADNGLCPSEHVNVQIIARRLPVPEKTLRNLERQASELCIDVDYMIVNTPDLCDIPLSYLEPAGYLKPESCLISDIDVQSDFDKNRFLGIWKIVKSTPHHFINDVYLTSIQDYFLKPDGSLATAYRGYLQSVKYCTPPGEILFGRGSGGTYIFNSAKSRKAQFRVLYTDYRYAVTYSCRNVENDRCTGGLQHISIMARDSIIDPDTMTKLHRYVRRACVDIDTLVNTAPDQCTIPQEYLQNISYTGQDRCQVANFPVQNDFDVNRFLGKWNTLKTLKYYHGDNTYLSMTHKYFIDDNDHFVLAFRGYSPTQDRCDGIMRSHLRHTSDIPGSYTMPEDETYQIIYTDYDYAVVYMCGQMMTDGHCLKEKTQVSILSRFDTVPDDVMTLLIKKVADVCIDTEDLFDIEPDLCLLSATDMAEVGYTGPPEDECQVDNILYQPGINTTMLSGKWYAIMSTPPSELLAPLSIGPVFFSFAGWEMIMLMRPYVTPLQMCGPAIFTRVREADGPGDYILFDGRHTAVLRIIYATEKHLVTYICFNELDDGTCEPTKGGVMIYSRSKVVSEEDARSLKMFAVKGCFDSETVKPNPQVECEFSDEIKTAAREEGFLENVFMIGCFHQYIPVQDNLDINKFAHRKWNAVWRSSSMWANSSVVPGSSKQVVIYPGEDTDDVDDDKIFLLLRSYKHSWGSCEPVEVLRLSEGRQPGDYTIHLGDNDATGIFRIVYADEETAVTYSCYDASGEQCSKDSLLVEILSTGGDIPAEKLTMLKGYANDACADIPTMVHTEEYHCNIPEAIVNAVQEGEVDTDYALPVAGCNNNLIKVNPNFDINEFVGPWNTIYSSIKWQKEGSSLSLYYQQGEGGIVYARKVYNVTEKQCNPTETGIHLERSGPGDYATLLNDFAVITKVLHVEDGYAVTYVCLKMAEDGTCDRDSLLIHFLSQTWDIPAEVLERLKQYVEGTCAEVEDIVEQSAGDCEIPESIKSAIHNEEITSDYAVTECSMEHIVVQDVANLDGYWNILAWTDTFIGYPDESRMTYWSGYGDGSHGTYLYSRLENNVCVTVAMGLTMEQQESFLGQYDNHTTAIKVLYLDETEAVFYMCTDIDKDGMCKPHKGVVKVASRNDNIPDEKFQRLKLYSRRVCLPNSFMEEASNCVIPDAIAEGARNGEFIGKDHVKASCEIKYIPHQTTFDLSKFTGIWYLISDVIYGYAPILSKVMDIRSTKPGQFQYLGRVYDESAHSCGPTYIVEVQETDTPGYFMTHDGNNMAMKVLYTDYTNAVLYWCKDINEDGTCNRNGLYVEILSRHRHMSPETRQELLAYMRKGCIEKDEDASYALINQCQIPNEITAAADAGTLTGLPSTAVASCQDRFIPVQKDFDVQKFTGHWYIATQANYLPSNETWTSYKSTFSILDDGTNVFVYTGQVEGESTCRDPISYAMRPGGEPGHFLFCYENGFNVTWKIVYTDYQVAVSYLCFKWTAQGDCDPNSRIVEILSREKEVPERTMRNLNHYIINVCGKVKDMKPTMDVNDTCEFPDVDESAFPRRECSFNDIVSTPDFSFLQMAGLWYEVARTRFTYNKVDSSLLFYKYLTEEKMIEGLYSGIKNGVCQEPLISMTKLHEDTSEPHSHLLGRLGGLDSLQEFVSFKILYFDGRYMIYYACYDDHSGGGCHHDKTEVTVVSRIKTMDDVVKSKIPGIMQSVCLKASDLQESHTSADCTSHLFNAPVNAVPIQTEPVFTELEVPTKCGSFVNIPVASGIVDLNLVGKWKVAAEIGLSDNSQLTKVIVQRHTTISFKVDLYMDGRKRKSFMIKPRCSDDRYGNYMSTLGSDEKGEWSSLKIVHSDSQTALCYWCLWELTDGTCHPSGVRLLLLARDLPIPNLLRRNILNRVNDLCVASAYDSPPAAFSSIPGAVLGQPIADTPLEDYNTVSHVSTFCSVDNIPADNFDQARQAGLWYEIARTPAKNLTMEATVAYYLPLGNGHIKMLYSGITSSGRCHPPMIGDLRPRCPNVLDGNYQGQIGQSSTHLWATWKVLYTDYGQSMLAMSCMDEDPNGLCSIGGTKVHIMSRTHTLPADVRAKLNALIETICLSPLSLVETTHDGSCLRDIQIESAKLKALYN